MVEEPPIRGSPRRRPDIYLFVCTTVVFVVQEERIRSKPRPAPTHSKAAPYQLLFARSGISRFYERQQRKTRGNVERSGSYPNSAEAYYHPKVGRDGEREVARKGRQRSVVGTFHLPSLASDTLATHVLPRAASGSPGRSASNFFHPRITRAPAPTAGPALWPRKLSCLGRRDYFFFCS
jgi:hypothetical protein